MLSIRAVFFRPNEPFTWASGIKSPIYCDNRLILTAPEARNEVEQAIACGFRPVMLGPSRLRTETAGLVACHTIQLMNQLNPK